MPDAALYLLPGLYARSSPRSASLHAHYVPPVHAPRPRRSILTESLLRLAESSSEDSHSVVEQLSLVELTIKPKELHLAFDCGTLRSSKYSRFKPLHISSARMRYGGGKLSMGRSDTATYIVWGAILALDPSEGTGPDFTVFDVPPRHVFVKIAVDEEGGEDLREDARLHQQLVDRGLRLGYYGIFTDSIGSTAVVTEDFDGETDVITPTSSP
ncbi:uncharacterized protein BXZ73DRAFT_95374 [Epithele typhae]|uniref:uncharacterized protein n=1 Tax=Epithele typhae TaxID=378194 RepID=UPI002008BF6B|nr:uncharacterized protein BXZ73DRAFT_95374 [Epithele typhae]KAH9945855.1 hypothetical protein BXZ73DRAFT_95374 [Epithele typhae]